MLLAVCQFIVTALGMYFHVSGGVHCARKCPSQSPCLCVYVVVKSIYLPIVTAVASIFADFLCKLFDEC